jgi:hypothetical protein
MSEALALPAKSAPAPANSVIAIFLMSSSSVRPKFCPLPKKPYRLLSFPEIFFASQREVPCDKVPHRRQWNSTRPKRLFLRFNQLQGAEHEGTFADYHCHWLVARNRRIRAITERSGANQFIPRGAKSAQFTGTGGFFVDEFFAELCFFTELRAICPEHAVDAFRKLDDNDKPV